MKITIGRIFQIGQSLKTEAGKQLVDFITYSSAFAEMTLRALRNGLTFRDNFFCSVVVYELPHDADQIISVDQNLMGILVTRTQSSTKFPDSFGWFFNDDGEVVVRATFTNSVAGDSVKTTLVVLY